MIRLRSFFKPQQGPIEVTDRESRFILNSIVEQLNTCVLDAHLETSSLEDLEDFYINNPGSQVFTKETIIAQVLKIINTSEKTTVGSIANAIDLPRSLVIKVLNSILSQDDSKFLIIDQDRLFTNQFINRLTNELGSFFASSEGVALNATQFCAREVMDRKALEAIIAQHNSSKLFQKNVFIDDELIMCREFLEITKKQLKPILNTLDQPKSLDSILSSFSMTATLSGAFKEYVAKQIMRWTKEETYADGRFVLTPGSALLSTAVFTPTVYITQLKTVCLEDLECTGFVWQSRLKEASIRDFKKYYGTRNDVNEIIVLTDSVITQKFLGKIITEAMKQLSQSNYVELVPDNFPELCDLSIVDSKELLTSYISPALMERKKGLSSMGAASNFYSTRELDNIIKTFTDEFAITRSIDDVKVYFQLHTIAEVEQTNVGIDIIEAVLAEMPNINSQELTQILVFNKKLGISNRMVCESLSLKNITPTRERYIQQARTSISQHIESKLSRLKIYLNGITYLDQYDTKLAAKLLVDTLEYAKNSLGLELNCDLKSAFSVSNYLENRYQCKPELDIGSIYDEMLSSLKFQLARTKSHEDAALVLHLAVLITYAELCARVGNFGLLKATGKYVPKILKSITKMECLQENEKVLLESFMQLKEFIMAANENQKVQVLVVQIKEKIL